MLADRDESPRHRHGEKPPGARRRVDDQPAGLSINYSPRNAPNSGARNVARTAKKPATKPANSTSPKVIVSDRQGMFAPPANRCGSTATSADNTPVARPPSSNTAFSSITML